MDYFLTAFGLLLHVVGWGAGAAVLLAPRRWRRFWPIFAPVAGMALQSLVVWLGAYADLAGTNAYGRWSELIPLALLIVALWQNGRGAFAKGLRAVGRLSALWLVMIVTLGFLTYPLSHASKALTTSSLGSCDAADYAAGARVLQEFSHHDRSGFIGLTRVVQVRSVDNFFDFWLRLNHFTPSALIALNGAVFGLAPYQIVSVFTAVLLVLSLPLVFWLARTLLGLSAGAALMAAACYGFSPLLWYAVYQVAIGQIIAAQAIALLTWCGVMLWRREPTWRAGLGFSGLLFVAYALILGAYNFILLVCWVPAIAYAGGLAIWTGAYARFARWVACMAVPLALAGVAFPQRVWGLAERFSLFRQYDFGWRIPLLTPEGWIGVVHGVTLRAVENSWRAIFAAAVIVLLGIALVRAARRRPRTAYLAICLSAPILVGYGFLVWRGLHLNTNASYDAYKLLSVFFPALLCVMLYWLTLLHARAAVVRGAALVLAVVVISFNLRAASDFITQMKAPPLIVDQGIVDVQRIESMPEVTSLNMRIPDFWTRLWANSFLLKRPQYFLTHTYEGRLNTPLTGEWDLNGGTLQVQLPETKEWIPFNPIFALVHTHGAHYVHASFGEGWYELERLPHSMTRWHWTKGDASFFLSNGQSRPLRFTMRLSLRSLVPRTVRFYLEGREVAKVDVSTQLSVVQTPPIVLPPGDFSIYLRSDQPAVPAGPGDSRLLGFAAYSIDLEVLSDKPPSNAGSPALADFQIAAPDRLLN